MSIKSYIKIARPDHWFKNIFVLPGTAIAALLTNTAISQFASHLILGLISVCLIASANYVINEWLDAESDRFHPIKKNRPSVVGNINAFIVYVEYVAFATVGLALAAFISRYFLITTIVFLAMGVLYNVKPFRTKDRVYLDVLSESVNNPIRLSLGWFIVVSQPLPPSSLLLGYWMGGAFLMGIKRYAEFRFIANYKTAELYRRSFRFYTEESLLISSFFYALSSAFFLGVFLIKYRIELLLSLPFFAILFTWYLYIGMKPSSPVQNPEHLYKEKGFMSYLVFLIAIISILLFYDLSGLNWFLKNAFIMQR